MKIARRSDSKQDTNTRKKLLQVGSNKEADAKRQGESQQKQPAQHQNPNQANAGGSRESQESDRRSSSPEEEPDAANEWPDYRSSGSSYNQQSQQQPNQQQQQSGKPNANGGKGYSVASTHDYLGYNSSNGQRQEKGYQQELWDDDKEGDLW
jgi:hypothetical protein